MVDQVPDNDLHCPECKTAVQPAMPACPKCGERLFVEHRGDVPRDSRAANQPGDLPAG